MLCSNQFAYSHQISWLGQVNYYLILVKLLGINNQSRIQSLGGQNIINSCLVVAAVVKHFIYLLIANIIKHSPDFMRFSGPFTSLVFCKLSLLQSYTLCNDIHLIFSHFGAKHALLTNCFYGLTTVIVSHNSG